MQVYVNIDCDGDLSFILHDKKYTQLYIVVEEDTRVNQQKKLLWELNAIEFKGDSWRVEEMQNILKEAVRHITYMDFSADDPFMFYRGGNRYIEICEDEDALPHIHI